MFPTAPPRLSPEDHVAFFFDFDGTLVDFADHPDAVRLDAETRACIAGLHERNGGALAIVTGREIASVDRFLSLPLLPVAGVHGLIRRDAGGRIHEVPIDHDVLSHLGKTLDELAATQEGLLVEHKAGAVALHYRQRPDLAAFCAQEIDRVTARAGGVTLLRGKAVIEVRAEGADKGQAISAFLEERPFAGRCPVFAGDDVTDEEGFSRVNQEGGITIKVGEGRSCARHRVQTITEFRRWLCETAGRFEKQDTS